jgi:hypothetical protein
MSEVRNQIFWLAGILDGEGWFGYNKSSQLFVGIESTDKDIVANIAKIFSYKIRTRHRKDSRIKWNKSNFKPTYTVVIAGEKAAGLMMSLLGIKNLSQRRRQKIISLLIQWKQRPNLRTHKLNSRQVQFIKEEYLQGNINQISLTKKYNVSKSAINRIVRGLSYV